MNVVTEEIVYRARRLDMTMAGYISTLSKLSVVGISKVYMYEQVKVFLRKQDVEFDCNNEKGLVWTSDISEALKKQFLKEYVKRIANNKTDSTIDAESGD